MGREIRLIGSPVVLDAAGDAQLLRGHQPWAVLARVLLADRPLTRRELSTELFPDAADPMGALRWCLAALRKAVGDSSCFVGDPVVAGLAPDVAVDVWSLAAGEPLDVRSTGQLLDGIDPKCGAEFETWLLVQRERTAALVDERLRNDVLGALAAGRTAEAVELAEIAARRSPLDERAQVLLVKSLAAHGRTDAARAHVVETEARLRRELGVEASPALLNAARRHVAARPVGVSGKAVVTSLLESGLAAIGAGVVDAGLDCLRRACHEAESIGDPTLHARCLLELGTSLVHAVRSHDDEGSLLLQQAVTLATDSGHPGLAAAALRELGYVDALAGRRPSAADHLTRALHAAGDDVDLGAGIRSVVAFNLVDWGRHRDGIHEYAVALDLARLASNGRRQAWVLGLGGWAHARFGDTTTARSWLGECIDLVEELRWVAFGPWPRSVIAELDLDEAESRGGRSSAADLRERLEQVFALSCQLSDPCWEATAARLIARALASTDDLDAAMTWIAAARTRCTRETDTWVVALAETLLTEVDLHHRRGRPDEADTTARELVAVAARTHMNGYLDLGLEALGLQPGGAKDDGLSPARR